MLNKTDVVHVLSPAKRAAQRDESFICLTPPKRTPICMCMSAVDSVLTVSVFCGLFGFFVFFSQSLPSVLRPGISHAFR